MRKVLLMGAVLWLSVSVSELQAQRVEALYRQYCADCHGEQLQGGMAMSLLDDYWRYGSRDEVLADVIRKGREESGMPPFGEVLDEAQIRALVIYIREQAKRALPSQKPRELEPDMLETEDYRLRVETIAEGFTLPWSLCFLPDGGILVTEREGKLWRCTADGGRAEILGVPPVFAQGQGGMLDVALHPLYAENGWIYLSFSDPALSDPKRSMTRIVRGRIRDGRWIDQEDVFRVQERYYLTGRVHFGCRLVFDRDGLLYFSIGDRGRKEHAQDLSRPNGKIHRLHDDGRIPADNPFVDRPDALGSIWTYGNRNPQGIVFDPVTGLLWQHEHGPRGGDELNLVQKGENYGWPEVTYGMNYNGTPITGRTEAPVFVSPVTHWTPSLAVCGLDVYRADRMPAYVGNLFVGALREQQVRRLVLEGTRVVKQEVVFRDRGRVRDVVVGSDGKLYLVINSPGKIVALSPEP